MKIWKYYLISRVFGFTFGLKLMEKGKENAQDSYGHLRETIPEAEAIAKNESEHEISLLGLLDEERLRYTGSMVLGLNDALMEMTGVLAGLTLALRDTKLIALAGSITGIAAALSMGASEYLATKTEKTSKNPLRASFYTIRRLFDHHRGSNHALPDLEELLFLVDVHARRGSFYHSGFYILHCGCKGCGFQKAFSRDGGSNFCCCCAQFPDRLCYARISRC
ncbi:MAG: VIT1/CCC1 transporter family protein [Syntrophales bacterium]